jgi:Ca-activated chloride channel family protein
MMRSTLTALALLLGLTGARAAQPTGLTVIGPDGTPRAACPLEHTAVTADVAGFVARVAVTQVFRNPFSDPVEAVYTFPLSERGAVDAMTMKTGDRTIVGQIKRRDEARAIYEAARDAGKTASLLDQERPNVFTQSLANLMPGATVEIRIEYTEPLVFRAGGFELVVPTVVGPRFVPPAGVPDADRVTPPVTPEGTRAGHDLSIGVAIDAGVPIRDVTAPLHAIDVERPAPDRAVVRLGQDRDIPNRDFVLRWTVAADQVQSAALAHRPASGGDGYVSLVLLPPSRVTPEAAAPKEMIFVIDRSGSQMGAPLEKAKETIRWILDHLNPEDTVQVVDFGSSSNQLFPAPQRATPETRRQARAYVDALQANGGTMMADAVQHVCAMPADDHRLRIVTFMTDGFVGNDFEVLDLVKRLRGTSRWFPFGTGNSVNRFLIDGMARLGGGEPYVALLGQPGETVARDFYEHVASPALTDVTVEWDGLDVIDVHPGVVADVWAERPLVIHARYRTPGAGRVVLRGYQQGRPYRQELAVTLPAREDSHAAIASMWARAKIDALAAEDLAGLQQGSFPKPLREQIESVALEHRLMTQFTSFVAVEERIVNEGGVQRTVRVPVEMPDGVRYEGIFGREAEPTRADFARAYRGAAVPAAPASESMSLMLAAPGREVQPISPGPAHAPGRSPR